ncbi:hypothetical protein D3C74_334080 [compost metagenome]
MTSFRRQSVHPFRFQQASLRRLRHFSDRAFDLYNPIAALKDRRLPGFVRFPLQMPGHLHQILNCQDSVIFPLIG